MNKENLMSTRGILLALVAVILVACSSQRQPAEDAVARISASLDQIRADAQEYASDQLHAVETSVERLKANLDKKDYSSVVQGAPSVASEVEALKTTVDQAKADAEATLA